jgi:hypothetical protein
MFVNMFFDTSAYMRQIRSTNENSCNSSDLSNALNQPTGLRTQDPRLRGDTL